MKSRIKKSWREKLADDKNLPKVGETTGKLTKRWGEGTFVIPAPREVDALMKQVPRGRLVTINELRAALASKHKTDFACPITTGIFSWIAAHAENRRRNQSEISRRSRRRCAAIASRRSQNHAQWEAAGGGRLSGGVVR